MKLIFTICSVNYLAGAKALAESVAVVEPDTKFVYVIADRIEDKIPESFLDGYDYIEVEQLGIENLNEFVETYNIIEFNTAIKPYAVKHLHERYGAEKIVYIDPDILVFDNLDEIWKNLDNYDFILTPHIIEPIVSDEFYSLQPLMLRVGVFNLGFIGINYNERSRPLIDWWARHMRDHGHSRAHIGEFFDQLIMNLLPAFSDNTLIERHPGYNVAGWNIHERNITKRDGKYFVNNLPLLFYHFSGMRDRVSKLVSKYSHVTTVGRPALAELLDLYRSTLKQHGHYDMLKIKCYYDLKPDIHTTTRWKMLKYRLKNLKKSV